ncbi:uncharacterized protein SCHCODRAFT_02700661 [Schizophyllum commune H4-8]|uniref:uncharacterized protein n=1 Tax=Schizophyllum commune (strain H4-8 / FGSC 9210) TaxID=578458 RepID=UPI0021603285|nr:uncharacterized protein SCHCODRAFT_02700661 [Schizophyllum commune H4-8]KAI5894110.1 hypothetical protein SCHCODRAFT_02700661 [Schizophyllum commune H4-8]
MSDSTTLNVNLFDGVMGGPCFGDGSDSESQQSQATCVGQEDQTTAPSPAPGPQVIDDPMQDHTLPITEASISTNNATHPQPASQPLSPSLYQHAIDAIDSALPGSPSATVLDSTSALELLSAFNAAPNFDPALAPASHSTRSPTLDTETDALLVDDISSCASSQPTPSAQQEDTHIPSQDSDIPTFHDDLRFDNMAPSDSPQDILTAAEPHVYEEPSGFREDGARRVHDHQAHGSELELQVELVADVGGVEDQGAPDGIGGGAYNEGLHNYAHDQNVCAHHDSPAAVDDFGDSRHIAEPDEYQGHPIDEEPVEHWKVSHGDDEHSADVQMSDDAGTAYFPAYSEDVRMAHAGEDGSDIPTPPQPEIGWQLGDEGSDDDLYVRDDEPPETRARRLDDHSANLDILDDPTANQAPEAYICPPSSSPPSSSPPVFFSSSQASRTSSQSSAFVDPVEKMDEDVAEAIIVDGNSEIIADGDSEIIADGDVEAEVVEGDAAEVVIDENAAKEVDVEVADKLAGGIAKNSDEAAAAEAKEEVTVKMQEDVAQGINQANAEMTRKDAPFSATLQPDSDLYQGEPSSWHREEPDVATTSIAEDSTMEAPASTKADVVIDTEASSEPKPVVPQKRKFEFDEDDIEILRHVPPPPPTTKRPTALAYKAQSKKLAKPFRPPAMKPKVEADDAVPPISSPPCTSPPRASSPTPSTVTKPPSVDRKKQHRTQRAASQFKSPLTPGASTAMTSNVRLTPQIQALERKLQVLKRAVKVRREGEEGTLEGLVKRWTEAGREVAWEVWGLTKEAAQGGDWGYGSGGQAKGGFGGGFGKEEDANKGWGWDKEDEKKGGSSWGWANEGDGEAEEENKDDGSQYKDEEEEAKPQQTLGTMLRLLGIAPETLGWDDNEEGFVDA